MSAPRPAPTKKPRTGRGLGEVLWSAAQSRSAGPGGRPAFARVPVTESGPVAPDAKQKKPSPRSLDPSASTGNPAASDNIVSAGGTAPLWRLQLREQPLNVPRLGGLHLYQLHQPGARVDARGQPSGLLWVTGYNLHQSAQPPPPPDRRPSSPGGPGSCLAGPPRARTRAVGCSRRRTRRHESPIGARRASRTRTMRRSPAAAVVVAWGPRRCAWRRLGTRSRGSACHLGGGARMPRRMGPTAGVHPASGGR